MRRKEGEEEVGIRRKEGGRGRSNEARGKMKKF